MPKKKTLEIEARCKVRDPAVFRKNLFALNASALYPNERGFVIEQNFNFIKQGNSGKIFRLRLRIFPSGRKEFFYTEKGKNKGKKIREKVEINKKLTMKKFFEKFRKFKRKKISRDFTYERQFRAEDYRSFEGVHIELFRFPHLGWFVEFELHRGLRKDIKDLKKVMAFFGFSFDDNIQESTKGMWQKYCRQKGIQYKPELRFSK